MSIWQAIIEALFGPESRAAVRYGQDEPSEDIGPQWDDPGEAAE